MKYIFIFGINKWLQITDLWRKVACHWIAVVTVSRHSGMLDGLQRNAESAISSLYIMVTSVDQLSIINKTVIFNKIYHICNITISKFSEPLPLIAVASSMIFSIFSCKPLKLFSSSSCRLNIIRTFWNNSNNLHLKY